VIRDESLRAPRLSDDKSGVLMIEETPDVLPNSGARSRLGIDPAAWVPEVGPGRSVGLAPPL